jgi:hypothetical protein
MNVSAAMTFEGYASRNGDEHGRSSGSIGILQRLESIPFSWISSPRSGTARINELCPARQEARVA